MTHKTGSPTPLGLPPVLKRARAVAAICAEGAESADRAGELATNDVEALRTSGLFGLMVPTHLGGLGASFGDYVEVAMALAQGSPAVALVFNMHASVTGALAQSSDEMARHLGAPASYFALRDRVLREASQGAMYAVAMSERGVGARLSAISTSYRPEGGGYRIIGAKAFVSGAGHAQAYLVAARSAVDQEIVSYFLVPAGEGLTVEKSWDSLGMRATGSHDLHLDTHVDAEMLLGGIEGLSLILAALMPQWLVASYSAVYVGLAQAAVRAGVEHVQSRSLEHLPAVRARTGRADAAVAAAKMVVREAARRVDDAPGSAETNRWVWRAKLCAGETAMSVASSMLEAAGSSALRRGHPLERLYRDARCGSLQPATSDVCADWLGLMALGRDPDHETDLPRW